jgi:hypothetical protein
LLSFIHHLKFTINNRLACEPTPFRSYWVFSGIPAGPLVRTGGPALYEV